MKITSLTIIISVPVRDKAKSGEVVRKDRIDGPFRNYRYEWKVSIDSEKQNANDLLRFEIRKQLPAALKSTKDRAERKDESRQFYVIARIQQPGETDIFRTIIKRQEIPVSLRDL